MTFCPSIKLAVFSLLALKDINFIIQRHIFYAKDMVKELCRKPDLLHYYIKLRV